MSKVYKYNKSPIAFSEVVAWLNEEKKKHPQKEKLFEFAIGTLNLFYSDKNIGNKNLLKLYNNLENDYLLIKEQVNIFLTKGETKSAYARRKFNI